MAAPACSAAWMAEAGRALFGDHYKGPLAAALGYEPRAVRRWFEPTDSPGWRPICRPAYLHARRLLAMQEAGLPLEVE